MSYHLKNFVIAIATDFSVLFHADANAANIVLSAVIAIIK